MASQDNSVDSKETADPASAIAPSGNAAAGNQLAVAEATVLDVDASAGDALTPLPQSGRHRRRWPLVAAIVAVLALGVGAWALLRPAEVVVVHPTVGPAVEAVYATGSVEPSVSVPIAGRISARLAEVDVDEGATVKEGQLLAQFEDVDVASALAQAQAQEALAKQTLDRTQKLLQAAAVTQAAYDAALAAWQVAKSATDHAAAEAAFLQLRAPSDGTIIRRDGEVGQLIAAGQTVFWLSAAPPRITSDVDEEDISRVSVGQAVLIHADAFPGRVFHGTVAAVTPMGDPVARSYRVRIAMEADTPLLIGMTVQTNIIITEHDQALLVPSAALDNGKIWVVTDGRLAARTVKAGIKGNDKTEIVYGIEETDAVVAKADEAFRDGMRVRASLAQ